MAHGMLRSLVVARSIVRVTGTQGRIHFSSSEVSSYVVSNGGGRIGSLICASSLGSQWSFRGRFSAAQIVMSVGDRGFAHGRTRRGGGGTPRLASASASKGDLEATVEDDQELEEEEWRSRNQNKRDSKRARQWGIELATFSPAQVKQAVRWAGLSQDVYDAVMIVKNLGTRSRVRNGRRRQYNYIGGLLRDVDPNVMEPVLKATKDGDVEGVIVNSSLFPDPADAEDDQSWVEEDEEDSAKLVAEEWLHGLVSGNSAVEDEVYSIYDVDYDRQELRKLVCSAQRSQVTDSCAKSEASNRDGVNPAVLLATETESNAQLRQFLVNIAMQQVENANLL